MARQFNYAKVNMQKRIAFESRTYDRPPPYTERKTFNRSRYSSDSSPFDRNSRVKWLQIYIGRHKGKTLPEILFRDISYINWLIKNDILYKAIAQDEPTSYQTIIAHQLKVISNRALHILPPKPKRDTCEFVIVVDRDGVFERFCVVKKKKKPKRKLSPGSKIVKRVPQLDVTIVFGYENPKLGCQRMAKCMRRTFFSKETVGATAEDFERFLMDPNNFDLSDLTSHTKLRPSLADHKKLKAEILRSLKH